MFQTAIIGGGVYGTSIAFHLARLGQTDVVLLDKGPIGGETSSQGAGFLASLRETESLARLSLYSMQFYAKFEQETGYSLRVRQVGSVKVATSDSTVALIQREQAVAREVDIEVQRLTKTELVQLVPAIDPSYVREALFIPFEGYVETTAPVAYGLAQGAHRLGATVRSHTPVQKLTPRKSGGYTLTTADGEIEAARLVIAAGAHSPALMAQLGAPIPVYPFLHQCSVVSTRAKIPLNMPAIRLPDLHQYVRCAEGGLLVGGTEPKLTSPEPGAPAIELELKRISPSHKELSGFVDHAADLFPALRDCFTIRDQRGLITVSPDLNFVVGQAPARPSLYVASGCNGRGVQSAPGVGRLVAELIVRGESWIDSAPLSIDRFGGQFQTPEGLRQACLQSLTSGIANESGQVTEA